jgi:MFS family permease
VFLAGQVTSIMGDGLALLAIPLLVLQMTGNPLLAALAAAARSAGYFVVAIPAGMVAPRAARRLPRVPLVAAAVSVAGLAAAGIGLSRGLASLMAANACLLFASSQASLLVRAIRQETVPRELLGRVTVAVRTLFVSATPLGAVLAGAGTAAFGGDPRPVFLICGTALASATVAAWFLSLRHQPDYGQAALRPVPTATAPDD